MTHSFGMNPLDVMVGNQPASRILTLNDGRQVAMRGARSGDALSIQQFVRSLSDESRRNRFFSPVRELTSDQLDRITRPRHAHELTLVAECMATAGSRIIAMAQLAVSEPFDAEFAVVVDDAWQRQGLGSALIGMLAEHAARSGLDAISGFVLAENRPMLALLSGFGCTFKTDEDPYMIRVVKHFDAHERTRSHRISLSCGANPFRFVLAVEGGIGRADIFPS